MTWFTEADVEAAARAIWADRYPASPWDIGAVEMHLTMRGHARAALTAIPDPRAAGFAECQRKAVAYHRSAAACGRRDSRVAASVGMWPGDSGGTLLHYADLHDGHADAIAALKPEDKP